MGYKLSNTPGILAVDEDAAPYVRIIYEKFLDFHSPAEIARFMAKTYGLPPARITRKNKLMSRNPYCENYIRRILSNPIYAGYTYLRVENDSSAGSEYICFEGKHEAIINRDNWEKAKFLLKSGKKSRESHSVRVTDKHILKKILQCSCGSYMTIGGCGKKRKDNSSYLYYLCTKKARERDMCGCDTRIALHAIETVIFASIMYLVNSGSANVNNGVTDYEKSINEELPKLKNRLLYLKRKLKENVDMLKGIPDGEVKRHLLEESEEIGREKSQVELRMNFIVKERDEIAKREVSDPIKRLSLIKDISSISDSMSDEERRSIIQKVLKKAVLRKVYSDSDEIKNYIVSLFLSPDFSEDNRSCDVNFQIRLVGRTKLVRILSPFQLDHITTTPLQSKIVKNWAQGKHPMHKVVTWNEYRKATMCTFEKLAVKFGMSINTIRPRIYIMNKLSCEALSFVLSLNRKDLIEQLTFIFLKKVTQMPEDMQLECIHRRLNAYLGRDEEENNFEDFLAPVTHIPEYKKYPQLGTNGHFLNDVIRWRKLKINKSLSLSDLVDYLGIKKAMISRKLALLERLSETVIENILELKNPIQIAKCTFRALEKISEFPKSEQIMKLVNLLEGKGK